MLLPHDFKMMFTCKSDQTSVRCVESLEKADFNSVFEQHGYPSVDIGALKKIHPGLMSMEDYFRSG